MGKTATLLGATGLIGGHILEELMEDSSFDVINVVVRSPFKIDHPKVNVIEIDFGDTSQFESAMEESDVVFSAIGTTQKKVNGDKEAYRKVDFDITVNAAKFSLKSGCKQFLVVSSIGADSNKKGFYLKLKGELEDTLVELTNKTNGLESLSIFRPSLLLGNRSEVRIAESIGQFFSKALSFLFPSKFKPIEAKTVAKAMVKAGNLNKTGVETYHYKEILELAS